LKLRLEATANVSGRDAGVQAEESERKSVIDEIVLRAPHAANVLLALMRMERDEHAIVE